MSDETAGAAPWQVLDKHTVYTSEWINVEQWAVRPPDGGVIPDYHVLDYAYPAVGVVAVGDDGRVLLIDHYRFITGTRGWEVPAGRMEAGESVEETAARELLEETGHLAMRWTVLGKYHPSNGSSNQVFHLMVARGLSRRSEPLDRNETLGLQWFTPAEVRELIRLNAILDGLTLTALGWALTVGVVG
ncbi:MAG TPA: NUDIX hydrolase [Methylomirabilota bacterium]|jgi:8-oxo-dGTP pyrophosphatase MutT (NUDIX family)|nr:NUDIX hydrolase [Methylomirabilota bacterium]